MTPAGVITWAFLIASALYLAGYCKGRMDAAPRSRFWWEAQPCRLLAIDPGTVDALAWRDVDAAQTCPMREGMTAQVDRPRELGAKAGAR